MVPVGRLLGISRATPMLDNSFTTHLLPQHSLAAQGLIWSSTVGRAIDAALLAAHLRHNNLLHSINSV
jgi:hypothetical protein